MTKKNNVGDQVANEQTTPRKNSGSDEVATTIAVPRKVRVQLDEVRVARAHRDGGLCPPLKTVVVEALVALIQREINP